MDEMEEKDFYSNGNVSITNSRFIVGSTTYAMNGVTSVKRGETNPSKVAPIIMCIIGAIALINGTATSFLVGAILIILGVLWFRAIKPEYIVFLNSASGESQALSSKDRKYIDDVINALNNAIIHRG